MRATGEGDTFGEQKKQGELQEVQEGGGGGWGGIGWDC